MPYNGSGVFAHDGADYPAVADTVIDATKRNNIDSDIATGLSTAITKDGQTTITANLPMATYRHTGVGNGVARTDYAAMGQVQDGKVNWLDGAGTADAITAVYSPAITALVDGQICFVRATAANATTTPTFAPNGLTAHTIVQRGGQALVAGNIAGDGHELILRYDLANTRWELLNPAITPTTLGTTDVAHGGTGRTTSTTAYGLIAAGTTATGAHQTLAAGATTEILVGGGAAALPVWTAATGTGAPVRANSPALVTPTGIVKGDVGLGNVENTALSTWGGSGNIVQVGTITVGTWTADAINAQYGGTGVTTFTIGDIMYAATTSGTPTQWSKLAGNTATTPKVLRSTGNGTTATAPAWTAIDEVIVVAVSDETTAITTGTAKVTFRMPFAMTLTSVRASLSTASSSGAPAVDINDGGVSIFSTTLTIDANEKTSTTAATAAVLSDTALADDAEITIDIDTAGTGAKGLKVYLIGTRT